MTIVEGKTYQHKTVIKSLGFRWNPVNKVWYKDNASQDEINQLSEYRGLIVSQNDTELFDNRSHKEKYGQCEDAPCCGCCGVHPYYG